MHGRRATRLRALAVGLVCGPLFAAGCGQKPSIPTGGGSTSSKAEKARRDAEALALGAFTGAADAQAKAVPETAARRDRVEFNVVADGSKAGATVSFFGPPKVPPVPPVAPAVPAAPAAPVMAPAAPAPAGVPRMPAPARPSSAAVVRERVVSTVAPTEAEADADALAQARDVIERKLAELDPPVRYRPSDAEVRGEFVRKDSRVVRPPDPDKLKRFAEEGITGNLVHVEYEVEVTAEQVRELRAQERAAAGLRLAGVAVAVALAGFLFLRADEWTKGYLTSWLALGAVALAGGAAALFIFA